MYLKKFELGMEGGFYLTLCSSAPLLTGFTFCYSI